MSSSSSLFLAVHSAAFTRIGHVTLVVAPSYGACLPVMKRNHLLWLNSTTLTVSSVIRLLQLEYLTTPSNISKSPFPATGRVEFPAVSWQHKRCNPSPRIRGWLYKLRSPNLNVPILVPSLPLSRTFSLRGSQLLFFDKFFHNEDHIQLLATSRSMSTN